MSSQNVSEPIKPVTPRDLEMRGLWGGLGTLFALFGSVHVLGERRVFPSYHEISIFPSNYTISKIAGCGRAPRPPLNLSAFPVPVNSQSSTPAR